MVVLSNIYYIILLAWGLHYLVASLSSIMLGGDLPWAGCDHDWNTEFCTAPKDRNNGSTAIEGATDPVEEYWE